MSQTTPLPQDGSNAFDSNFTQGEVPKTSPCLAGPELRSDLHSAVQAPASQPSGPKAASPENVEPFALPFFANHAEGASGEGLDNSLEDQAHLLRPRRFVDGTATDLNPSDTEGVAAASPEDSPPHLAAPRKGRSLPHGRLLVQPAPKANVSAEQRLLLLDTWNRSGLPAGDFAALVGVSKHTLYAWKKKFDEQGPAGLMDQPKGGPRGSRLPDLTKRTILMLKKSNPEWGVERISGMLARGPALPASPSAVARVLHEAGYETVETPTTPHPDKPRSFERARPNQLWQTDLFTFMLKRQNRRIFLVAFMDDHSRYIVSYGLHASASTAMVLEVLQSGINNYGPPQELLTDNGPQYVTWRGKSAFTKACEKQGIKQIVATPRRPQTLGKIERFWGTLWRECIESAIFVDLEEARLRIGHFIDYYNFQRVHQGIEQLVPADRFFNAAPDVLKTLKARVAANALELARNGTPKKQFYLTGQVEGQNFSVHAEGERVILTRNTGQREEIELAAPVAEANSTILPQPVCPQPVLKDQVDLQENAPGVSAIDELPLAEELES